MIFNRSSMIRLKACTCYFVNLRKKYYNRGTCVFFVIFLHLFYSSSFMWCKSDHNDLKNFVSSRVMYNMISFKGKTLQKY